MKVQGLSLFVLYCAPNEAQSPLSERSGTALQLRSGRFDSGMGFVIAAIQLSTLRLNCPAGETVNALDLGSRYWGFDSLAGYTKWD